MGLLLFLTFCDEAASLGASKRLAKDSFTTTEINNNKMMKLGPALCSRTHATRVGKIGVAADVGYQTVQKGLWLYLSTMHRILKTRHQTTESIILASSGLGHHSFSPPLIIKIKLKNMLSVRSIFSDCPPEV